VLKEHIGLLPRLPRNTLGPLNKRGFIVVKTMQAQISPGCRRHHRALELLLLDDAHRDVPLTHRVVDLLVEPTLVPELEHVAATGWQKPKESAEAVYIFLEVGRQLKENWPQPVTEHCGVLQ
jgi:hypothetical protein